MIPQASQLFSSTLDYLTYADALTNPQLAFLLLIITFLYGIIACHFFLLRFSLDLMQNTEYTP